MLEQVSKQKRPPPRGPLNLPRQAAELLPRRPRFRHSRRKQVLPGTLRRKEPLRSRTLRQKKGRASGRRASGLHERRPAPQAPPTRSRNNSPVEKKSSARGRKPLRVATGRALYKRMPKAPSGRTGSPGRQRTFCLASRGAGTGTAARYLAAHSTVALFLAQTTSPKDGTSSVKSNPTS